jgi:hypothetical protein
LLSHSGGGYFRVLNSERYLQWKISPHARATFPTMSAISLAATWNPSPTCLAGNGIWQIFQNCANGAQCWYFELGPPATSDCLPPSYNPTSYYSPGQCPHGYTSACGSTQTVSSGNTQVTETAYTCCPSSVQSTKVTTITS